MHRWTRPLAAAALAGLFGLAAARAADAPPKEGDKAPDIDLPATQLDKVPELRGAKEFKLSDLHGKNNVVLYFFPKAMTLG